MARKIHFLKEKFLYSGLGLFFVASIFFVTLLSLHAINTSILWTFGRDSYVAWQHQHILLKLVIAFFTSGFSIVLWLIEWIITLFRAVPFF